MPRLVKPGSISVLDRAKIAQTGTIWCSLFQDNKTARDLVGGVNIALPGGFAVQEPGTVATFNGSQAQNVAFKLPGPGLGNSIVVAARFKATATPGSSPGAAFTVGASAGGQGSIGVGIDTSNNVGAAYLTSVGAGLNARSAGALNTWYTVYAQWNNTNAGGSLTKAWINGKPATTDQGTTAFAGTTGAFGEISIGAQHRSAGFLRNFTGSIEWAALMHLETAAGSFSMTDDMAEALYEQDYPYSLLVKPKGKIWVPAAAGSTYTLTADAGSIAVNGNAATLAFNRVLTADAGSYSVAGQAVGLAFNRVLSAATANIPVAGQDATLTYTNNGFTYTLSAEAGAFSVTGQDARLVWSGEQTTYSGGYEHLGRRQTPKQRKEQRQRLGIIAQDIKEATKKVARAVIADTGRTDPVSHFEDHKAQFLQMLVDELKGYQPPDMADVISRQIRIAYAIQEQEEEEILLLLH